jgi:hypothetical protein
MAQAAGEAGVLAYAGDAGASVSPRGWKVLFWVGAAQLAAVVLLMAASSPGMLPLFDMLKGASRSDWFVQSLIAQMIGLYVMVAANALAVAGYWAAWHGRPPRPWFMAYAPTALVLMALLVGLTVVMAANSPHQLTPSSSIGTSYFALVIMVPMFVVLNLPLFLLLFPRIRRGCLAR